MPLQSDYSKETITANIIAIAYAKARESKKKERENKS